MKPIGIVIPWFGRNLKGGAETHAWQIASCLAAREHDVEVLTTRCRSHQDDWATNHLPTGLTREPEGFSIRRFTVKRRNRKAFDRVAAHLQGLPKTTLKPSVSPLSKADHRAQLCFLFRVHLRAAGLEIDLDDRVDPASGAR